MNERTKELAFLAAKETGSKFDCDKVWLEKFAELILEECAKVCDDYALYSSNPMNFAENCAETIRKMK